MSSTTERIVFARLDRDLKLVRQSMAHVAAVGVREAEASFTHYLKRPGRLFRPVLTLVSSYIFDEAAERTPSVVAAATGMELLHLATLCHDDLCDRAATRRGYPTVNAAFGDEAALLSGDYLLACATSAFSSLGRHEMQVAGNTLKDICLGQMLEMADVNNLDRSEEAYLSVISGKTAALMAACSHVGAAAAGADEPDQEIMAAFGHSLGMAFQIWDDVLDIWAPPGATGKARGQDIENGVYTLPVIHALREERTELAALLGQRPLDPRQYEELLRLLDRCDARQRAMDSARRHIEHALTGVRQLRSPVDAVAPLIDVARRLMPEIDHLLPE
ncbi:polyprenyl synthetase family protein [Streptomyces sp. NPDC055099]